MKLVTILLALLFASPATFAEDEPADVFYADMIRAEEKFRVSQAEILRKADKVVLYLVDFDGVSDEILPDEEKTIEIAPYDSRTKILSTKEVPDAQRKKLLDVLCNQIAKLEHSGGAFCHFPIHGIRIYSGEDLLHEGTFCWVCGNFSFSYPQGSSWLDVTAELRGIFTALVPIPQGELDRFYKKHPGAKPKGEQDGGEQPATRSESK